MADSKITEPLMKKNSINDLKKYRKFLETIPLDKYREELKNVQKYFIKLRNGFVVFNENYLKPIIDNIDNIEAVRKAVKEISLELSGESYM